MFRQLALLPHYSSARDCDTVFKAMYQKRATRLGRRAREAGLLTGATGVGAVAARARRLPGSAEVALEPYEADDVREAFLPLIHSRQGAQPDAQQQLEAQHSREEAGATLGRGSGGGGDVGSSDDLLPLVTPLPTAAAFQQVVDGAPADRVVAVWFTASWCPPCQQFKPQFVAAAAAFRGVTFAAIDVDVNGVEAERHAVRSMPTVLLFGRGGQELARMTGPQQLLQLRHRLRSCSQQLTVRAAPVEEERPRLDVSGAVGAVSAALSRSNVKVNVNVRKEPKVRHLAPEDDDGEVKGEEDDQELWAALEAACAALGYDTDGVVALLEGADFPPSDILAYVQQQLGRGSRGAVAGMLRQQRPALLGRMKVVQQELRRHKSEQEKAALERVRALGRCPADFEWIKCQDGSGYRCAGGSHFVSEAEVNFVEL